MGNGRSNSLVSSLAVRFTVWSEKYIPDAFVFALIATVIVAVLGFCVAGAPPSKIIESWGQGFWELIPFTMQMALIIITGYVLASSPPVFRFIDYLASVPKTGRSAVLMVAIFAMLSSWFNWGFSLVFSAILAKRVAQKVPETDYRALAASSFLGLGSVWAQGLSSSASLQMATSSALQPAIRTIIEKGGIVSGGLIPLKDTIFLWQSFLSVFVEVVIVACVIWLITPTREIRTAKQLGIKIDVDLGFKKEEKASTVGEWLERKPYLNLIIFAFGFWYLYKHFSSAESAASAVTLNIINFTFLILGFLFHWTPARLMSAVRDATPAVWGVILQFPFYAGIAGMIVYTGLNAKIADFFVAISTQTTFPFLIAVYSAVLGVFVPSGGSKWIIEAPYVMAAAHDLKIHLGWMVCVYNLGEALANLIQPFWMLPTLAILGLKARDVMGYTLLVFLVLTPIVLIMVTLLSLTLKYPL